MFRISVYARGTDTLPKVVSVLHGGAAPYLYHTRMQSCNISGLKDILFRHPSWRAYTHIRTPGRCTMDGAACFCLNYFSRDPKFREGKPYTTSFPVDDMKDADIRLHAVLKDKERDLLTRDCDLLK